MISVNSFKEKRKSVLGPGIDFPLVMNYRAAEQQSSRADSREELKVKGELNKYMVRKSFTIHSSLFTSTCIPYFYFLNGYGDVVYF